MLELSLPFLSSKQKIDLATQSSPYSAHCQILASNDLLAVNTWYSQFQGATFSAYQRVGERLLLWCTYIQASSLAKLK